MEKIVLFETTEGITLHSCQIEDINPDKLAKGTVIYELGISHPSIPPGRCLAVVSGITKILTANVKPVIDKR